MTITVPLINPLRYKKVGYTDNFNTKFFDLYLFPETIRNFEEKVTYYQPFTLDDPLVQQIVSDADSLSISFYTASDGDLLYTQSFAILTTTIINTVTYNVFQLTTDLNNVGTGSVYAIITGVKSGSANLQIESNRICIQSEKPDTVLIKYRNYKHYEDVIFEKDTALYFYVRVQGYVKHNLPEKVATTYEDQNWNATMLKNVPYNSFSFITDSVGVPTYMIDIVNRVFGCSSLFIDGRGFTIPQEAKWEQKEEEFYPMRGWGIEMMEAVVKSSLEYGGTTGGGGGVNTPKKELWSDWWATTPGSHIVSGTSAIFHYSIADITDALILARSGAVWDEVNSSPGNRQMVFNSTAHQFECDAAYPFEAGETVFCLFKK